MNSADESLTCSSMAGTPQDVTPHMFKNGNIFWRLGCGKSRRLIALRTKCEEEPRMAQLHGLRRWCPMSFNYNTARSENRESEEKE